MQPIPPEFQPSWIQPTGDLHLGSGKIDPALAEAQKVFDFLNALWYAFTYVLESPEQADRIFPLWNQSFQILTKLQNGEISSIDALNQLKELKANPDFPEETPWTAQLMIEGSISYIEHYFMGNEKAIKSLQKLLEEFTEGRISPGDIPSKVEEILRHLRTE